MPEAHGLTLDESAHSNDGLSFMGGVSTAGDRLYKPPRYGQLGQPETFPKKPEQFLWAQHDALGKRNLPAIRRIVACKYRGGIAFNRKEAQGKARFLIEIRTA